MLEKTPKNEPFIPTTEQWSEMYAVWHEKMSKSLWACGNPHECREAVHEAFLKAMGLSDHLELREELTPKVVGCWYGFLRNQARGILSNYHRHAGMFDSLVNDSAEEEGAETDFEAADRAEFGRKLRLMVDEVCRKAGVEERNRRAFVLFVLDEVDGRSVVRAFPQLLNTNNLYQVKNRIMKLLGKAAERFEEMHGELIAA